MAIIKPKGRRLSENEWLEIVNLAQNGQPVADIAKLFKTKPGVIYKGLKRKSVRLGSNAQLAAEEVAKADREKLRGRIIETKDQDYRYIMALQKMLMNIAIKASQEGVDLGSKKDAIKAIKDSIDAMSSATNTKWKILGLDKDNADIDKELPHLPIRVLSDDEVAAMRDRQAMETLEEEDDLPIGEDEEDEVIEGDDEEDEVTF